MKKNRTNKKTEAWTHYWKSAAKDSSGCIPGAPASVAELLKGIWADFFETLPRQAKLLDLGTGGGAVLREAQAGRPDLQLTGVDSAKVLPDLGGKVAMFPDIYLEKLPFKDGSFDVITSQFAIEYASLLQAVSEVKRILAPGGRFLLFCHHADSIIVHDNIKRLAAIEDLLAGSGLLNGAIKVVKQKKTLLPKKQKYLAQLLRKMQSKHPEQPLINEVAGIIAGLMTEAGALQKLLSLRRDIEMEGRRISALQVSALSPAELQNFCSQLSSPDTSVQYSTIFVPGTKTPLAWYLKSACDRGNGL